MTEALIEQMVSAVPTDAWPHAGDTLVVAVSGGADSVALVHLLHALNRARAQRWTLHVAHLNHELQSTGDQYARFVQDLASAQGWDATIDTRPVRDLAASQQLTLEECGRRERYALFERVLDACRGVVVATAHHADDQVETMLHRLLRGTGLRGLSGIPAVRPLSSARPHGDRRVIRPLLTVRRTALRNYLNDQGISWCEDDSNSDLEFTRNRIRHDLIPRLRSDYNPAIDEALLRLSRQCGWANTYLEEVARKRIGDVALEIGSTAVTLSAKALCATPPAFRTEVVRRAVVLIGAGEKKLTFQHLCAVVELAERDVSGKQLDLPDGVRVTRLRDRLQLERP